MITIDRENGKITSVRELFYTDIEYFDLENKVVCGDMGFEFGEKRDTINADTLEENIHYTIEGCKDILANGEIDLENGNIAIYEVCKSMFTSTEDYVEDEEIVEEDFPLWGYDFGNESKVMFRVAFCTKEKANELDLEKYVGKIGYFILDNID